MSIGDRKRRAPAILDLGVDFFLGQEPRHARVVVPMYQVSGRFCSTAFECSSCRCFDNSVAGSKAMKRPAAVTTARLPEMRWLHLRTPDGRDRSEGFWLTVFCVTPDNRVLAGCGKLRRDTCRL